MKEVTLTLTPTELDNISDALYNYIGLSLASKSFCAEKVDSIDLLNTILKKIHEAKNETR